MYIPPGSLIVMIVSATGLVLSLAMFFLVLWQAPHKQDNQLVALYMLTIALWSASAFMARFTDLLDHSPAIPVYLITIFLATNTLALFMVAAHFGGLWEKWWVHVFIFVGLIYTVAVVIPLSFAGRMTVSIEILPNGRMIAEHTPVLYASSLLYFFLSLTALGIFWSIRERRTSSLLIGGIGAFLGMFTSLFPPLTLLGIPILSGTVSSVFFARAILQENLFNPLVDINRELAQTNDVLAQANLKLSERTNELATFQSLAQNAVDAISITDLEGKILYANRSFYRLLGYDHDDSNGKIIGLPLSTFVPEETLPEVKLIVSQVPGEGWNGEIRLKREDSAPSNALLTVFPLLDKDGKPVNMAVFIHDITERQRVEEEKKRINLMLEQERNMFIRGTVVVFKWENKEGWPVEYVSPNVEDILGYSDKELMSGQVPYAKIIPEEDLERVASEVATHSESGVDNFEHEPYRIVRKDGETIWVADYTTILRDETGQITHYLGYIVDITSRKRAEQADREQRVLAEALHDVAAAINSTLDFDEVLDRILINVERVVPNDWADIMLIKSGIAYTVRGRSNHPDAKIKWKDSQWEVDETPNFRRMVETRKALAISDTLEYPGWIGTPEGSWLRSFAGAPIIVEGQVIGFINLSSTEAGFFTHMSAERLQTFADQAAIAIRNARLYEAEERRAEQFQVISEVGQHITSILAVSELLWEITGLIKKTLGYYLVGIALIEGDELVFKAGAGGVWETPRFQPPRLKVEREGITGWVARSNEPLLVPDVNQEPRNYPLPEASETSEIRSELAVPLKTKEAVIGVLHAQSDRLNAFDESDLAVLQSLANQAAIAIENARLYETIRRRQRYLGILHRISRRVVPEHDRQKLLQAVVDGLAEEFGYPIATILLGNDETCELEVAAMTKSSLEILEANMDYRQSYDEGIMGWVMRHGSPRLANDTEQEPDYISGGGTITGSELVVPILHQGKTIGVLTIASMEKGAFDELDQEALLELADDLALGLENLRLSEQLQEAAAEAERHRLARELHDAVTQTIWAATLTAEIIPRVWVRDPEEGHKRLEALHRLMRGALVEMRTLLLELRPDTLSGMKLDDLLRQLVTIIANRTGVLVTMEMECQASVPPDVKIALYRIAQEAMNNIAKHAQANRMTVRLLCQPEKTELTINDDGRGFDHIGIPPGHLGLDIMRERAESIGAIMEITSQVRLGTQIKVVWPGTQ